MKTNSRQRLWRIFFQDISLWVIGAIFLKISAKGTPEAMAKFLEIHAFLPISLHRCFLLVVYEDKFTPEAMEKFFQDVSMKKVVCEMVSYYSSLRGGMCSCFLRQLLARFGLVFPSRVSFIDRNLIRVLPHLLYTNCPFHCSIY